MRNMIRARRYPSPQGIFLDRRLKASERRTVRVADLGRDADVLAVSSGHPACASGVSRVAARGIASGTIRTWSQAGVPTPESGDTIALRRAGTGVDRFVEPRFRAGYRLPTGARAVPNGGLSEAASGNLSIAAVTSWSRARAFQGTTCAVPVGGTAPSDVSVRALSHPDAYPISFVTLRRLRTATPIAAAFLKYLTGPRATASFRQRGMLLVKEAWPGPPGRSWSAPQHRGHIGQRRVLPHSGPKSGIEFSPFAVFAAASSAAEYRPLVGRGGSIRKRSFTMLITTSARSFLTSSWSSVGSWTNTTRPNDSARNGNIEYV